MTTDTTRLNEPAAGSGEAAINDLIVKGRDEQRQNLSQIYAEIRRLDLEQHVAELDAIGFTVVPPEKVAPPEFTDRLVEAILDVAERRNGVRPDFDAGSTHAGNPSPVGQHLWYLLFEDRVFEEVVMNPTTQALVTYLLGQNKLLSSLGAGIKGPGTTPLFIHTDNQKIPPPFPAYAQVANATWALTDYTKENGALCFVPGSHKLGRHPAADESLPEAVGAVPVVAPRGSLIVWSGNMWHGAFPRTAPGVRINLIVLFCRMYLKTQEVFGDAVPQEILDRNSAEFRRLMGLDDFYSWAGDGPDYSKSSFLFVPDNVYS